MVRLSRPAYSNALVFMLWNNPLHPDVPTGTSGIHDIFYLCSYTQMPLGGSESLSEAISLFLHILT